MRSVYGWIEVYSSWSLVGPRFNFADIVVMPNFGFELVKKDLNPVLNPKS